MTGASVVGAAIGEPVKEYDGPVMTLAAEIFWSALKDSGLESDDVDGLIVTPPGTTGPDFPMFASNLADYLELRTSNLALLENGGTTGALAMKYAVDQITLGRSEVVSVVALDIRRPMMAGIEGGVESAIRDAIQNQTALYGAYDAPYGLGAPTPYYAMSSQRYMEKYDLTREDVAEVPVALREMASRHPKAMHRDPITVEDVLESEPYSGPIHLLDSSQFCTGSASIVLADKGRAREIADVPVRVTGVGEHNHPSHFVPSHDPITSFEATQVAGGKAFGEAEKSPEDIDVAEVYGVFSATELMIYEDLGFFDRGKAAEAVKEGRTRRDGDVAMNPTGGRLSFGHPTMATPIIEAAEITEHLRGSASKRQVPNAEVGLVHAEHGMVNGGIVFIMEAEK